MEDSTNAGRKPLLLVNLAETAAGHRAVFKQERVYMRGVALVLAEVMAFGRHTVTQLLQVLGVTEGDWSSWRRLWSKPRGGGGAAGATACVRKPGPCIE